MFYTWVPYEWAWSDRDTHFLHLVLNHSSPWSDIYSCPSAQQAAVLYVSVFKYSMGDRTLHRAMPSMGMHELRRGVQLGDKLDSGGIF